MGGYTQNHQILINIYVYNTSAVIIYNLHLLLYAHIVYFKMRLYSVWMFIIWRAHIHYFECWKNIVPIQWCTTTRRPTASKYISTRTIKKKSLYIYLKCSQNVCLNKMRLRKFLNILLYNWLRIFWLFTRTFIKLIEYFYFLFKKIIVFE